ATPPTRPRSVRESRIYPVPPSPIRVATIPARSPATRRVLDPDQCRRLKVDHGRAAESVPYQRHSEHRQCDSGRKKTRSFAAHAEYTTRISALAPCHRTFPAAPDNYRSHRIRPEIPHRSI